MRSSVDLGSLSGARYRRVGELVVLPIVLGVVCPLMRAVEARLPDWLTRILLGSTSTPSYTGRQTPLDR